MNLILPWLIVLLLAACSDLAEPSSEVPVLEYEVFRSDIEPVLVARCSNPTTCHGAQARPYAIYAPGANRSDPADLFRDLPLTDDESRANFDRSRSFAADFGYGSELLRKPLAESEGGVLHTGGAIFMSRGDREYRMLTDWVQGVEHDE